MQQSKGYFLKCRSMYQNPRGISPWLLSSLTLAQQETAGKSHKSVANSVYPMCACPCLFHPECHRDKVAQKIKDTCIPSRQKQGARSQFTGSQPPEGTVGLEEDGCKALQLPPRQALKGFLGFVETEPWRKQHGSEKQKQPMSFTTPRFSTSPEATLLRALQQCDLATHQMTTVST